MPPTLLPHYVTEWRKAAPTPVTLRARLRAAARGTLLDLNHLVHRPPAKAFLRGVYCHYVFDDQREDFERIITRLKTQGQFVDTDTCLDMVEGRRPVDGPYFHLSFDDGFRNVFTNALPVLQRHGVPAIFFVPTAFVEADWETARRYCLETAAYHGVIEMVKWEDLRAMVAAGFEVGSHTMTHARFSDISADPKRLELELAGSKQMMEAKLGRECKYISWPYGTLQDADDTSLQMAAKAGYRGCFGAIRGSIQPGRTDRYRIPRHHFEAQWPVRHVSYFARGGHER